MPLTSNLFTKPRRSSRLDKCLVDDAAHVTLRQPREQGEHVTRIQLALLAIQPNVRLGIEASRAEYGPNTAAAVLRFKRERNILNTALHQTVPDNVVGKKTIAALDEEMRKRQLPPGRQPQVKLGLAPFQQLGFSSEDLLRSMLDLDLKDILGLGPGVVLPPLDIFVQFDGADAASEGLREPQVEANFARKVNTTAYLKSHLPAVAICFRGGRGAKNKGKDAAAEVLKMRAIARQGVTVIVGSSVGAVPALDCATALSGKVSLDYLALSDGAFFAPGEVGFPPPKVTLKIDAISATKKDNFFQRVGHELLSDARGPGGFMQGTEFHLPLDGFRNVDLAANPGTALREAISAGARAKALLPEVLPGRLKILKGHADTIHTKAADQAEIEIEKEKTRLFRP